MIAFRIFDRATGWAERKAAGLDEALTLPAIGLHLTAASLYAGTGLA